MIILEGPNGTGKTTLALALQKKLNENGIWHTILHSEIPQSKTEFDRQVLYSLSMFDLPVIQDRAPWVSDYVYAPLNANRRPYITKEESRLLIEKYSRCIVYCNSMNPEPKSNEHEKERDLIRSRYDELFNYFCVARYDKDDIHSVVPLILEKYFLSKY